MDVEALKARLDGVWKMYLYKGRSFLRWGNLPLLILTIWIYGCTLDLVSSTRRLYLHPEIFRLEAPIIKSLLPTHLWPVYIAFYTTLGVLPAWITLRSDHLFVSYACFLWSFVPLVGFFGWLYWPFPILLLIAVAILLSPLVLLGEVNCDYENGNSKNNCS